MKLTGKCKDDFEKWYLEEYHNGDNKSSWTEYWMLRFNEMRLSMQYGVYVDFFDSVGIFVSDKWNYYNVDKGIITEWGSHLWTKKEGDMNIRNKISHQEARVKAIEKANEIYNESNTRI